MIAAADLPALLRAANAAPVLPTLPDLSGPHTTHLDLTAANPRLAGADLRDTGAFTLLINQLLTNAGATVGLGGYLEDRVIYRRAGLLFGPGTGGRSLHLGIDVWCPAGTPVAAPLPATLHSAADNAGFGDYGPTVILRHQLGGHVFHSLYGHLTRTDLPPLQAGQPLAAGAVFAHVGPPPENGDWPPHLHFQLITDLPAEASDFPGVAVAAERAQWAARCPNPNLLLRSRWLP